MTVRARARVSGVTTVDTLRSLDGLLNATVAPFLLAALCEGESGRHERSWRDRRDLSLCDVSGGLVQRSICSLPPGIPGIVYDANGHVAPSAANLAAMRSWAFSAANVIPDAERDMTRHLTDAESVLGASDARVPLLALCWWNKPNLGPVPHQVPTRAVSAAYWLSDDLAQLDPTNAAHRATYQRAIDAMTPFAVPEEDTVPDSADTFPYTPPEFAPVTDLPSAIAAVQDLQRRFTTLDQQQHFQTELFRSLGQMNMTDEQRGQFIRSVVDMLDPAHKNQWKAADAPKA